MIKLDMASDRRANNMPEFAMSYDNLDRLDLLRQKAHVLLKASCRLNNLIGLIGPPSKQRDEYDWLVGSHALVLSQVASSMPILRSLPVVADFMEE